MKKKKPHQKTLFGHASEQGKKEPQWHDYSSGEVGEMVHLLLNSGRSVLLGTSPTGELLTARIYHAQGYTPLYGRSIGELKGRYYKLFGSPIKASKTTLVESVGLESVPMYGSLQWMVEVLGWELERARTFMQSNAEGQAWARSDRFKRTLQRVCNIPPPPL